MGVRLVRMVVGVISYNFQEEIDRATPVPELVEMKEELRRRYASDAYQEELREEQAEVSGLMHRIIGCEGEIN